jgi:ribA/ribD-fused uncharacterized protein
MKYSIEQIKENSKYIFFWGHHPSKDGLITKTCFSQWWLSSLKVDDVLYKTAEHWMMAKKAELFHDFEAFERIIKVNSPAEAKKIGREVKNYEENLWLENRFEIVKKGNFHKFRQNLALREFLVNTKDRIIVEASPVDAIWGVGLAPDNPQITNPKDWKGLNLLGFALMEVRDELVNDFK